MRVKIQILAFHLFGFGDEEAADEVLDELDALTEARPWPVGEPDTYKYKESEGDPEIKCAVELKIRASSSGQTVDVDRQDMDAAMTLIAFLREISLGHGLEIEVDFNRETIGSIDKGRDSQSLREGLIEPWSTDATK